MNIGESLKKARLEKNITLEEMEAATRIRKRYLEALENEEWDKMPGRVYIKGFLKTYCRYVKIDDRDILAAFEELVEPEKQAAPLPEKIEIPGKPKKKMGIILAVLAILLLFCAQYIYKNYFMQPQPPPIAGNPIPGENDKQNEEQPNENSPAGNLPTQEGEEGKEAVESMSLSIKAVYDRCWIRVNSGNKLLFEGTLKTGEEKLFENLQQVRFILGNPDGVEVALNGKILEFPVGQVAYGEYRLENNEIIEIE